MFEIIMYFSAVGFILLALSNHLKRFPSLMEGKDPEDIKLIDYLERGEKE